MRRRAKQAIALATAAIAVALFAAAPASASLEQTGTFAAILEKPKEVGVFPEEVQLAGVGGLAVNSSGAGGVPAGTVYGATYYGGEAYVVRYEPEGTGLIFSERWSDPPPGFASQRCGPDSPGAVPCDSHATGGAAADIDIDQSTGNVYIFNVAGVAPGTPTVTVFDADGSKEIARFGERAPFGEPILTSPTKVHGSYPGAMAVDDSGNVYLSDIENTNIFYHRLMVFSPQSPGDYEHYGYAGQGADVAAGSAGRFPLRPVLDDAGHVFIGGEDYVQEYDLADSSAPICSFSLPIGGITASTVDPSTGEPFYYTAKNKKVHQLSACNGEGKFTETGEFTLAPKRGDLSALVFDPERRLEPSRLPGVLYGATPEAIPGSGGSGQPGQSSIGYIFAPPKELAPKVEAQSVDHVSATGAELHAQINPKGSVTSYVFQYVDDAAFAQAGFAAAQEAPAGGGVVGDGQEAIGVSAVLSELEPGTGYHYRAVATSHCSETDEAKVCEEAGPDQAFHTFPTEAPGLADGRAYELVSPVEKQGGQVLPADPGKSSCGLAECKPGSGYTHFPMQSTPGGEAIAYEGTPFSTEGAVIENEYLSKRSASGWQTTNLTPPLLESKEGQLGYRAFDPGLTQGLLGQTSPSLSPEAPSDFRNLYLQPTGSPDDLSALLASEPPNRVAGTGFNAFDLTYAGASADLSHVFFEANDALTEATPFAPEASDGGAKANNLYEWSEGQLRLVNVLPGNTEAPAGAALGSGKQLKSGNSNSPLLVATNAVSTDGSRVFWSSEAGQVYVREGAETTRKIEDPGKFLSASRDGSRVLLDNGHLVGLGDEEPVTDLTQGKGGFQGIAGQSEDLSRLYFVDTAVLSGEEENDQGAKAQAGKDNLYAWEEGAITFVATLLSKDSTEEVGTWTASPVVRTAEASPDGRWLAFLSEARLTGYDNTGARCVFDGLKAEFVEGPCQEAYLYDSATGELTCASCNPSNERPYRNAVLRVIKDAAGSMPQPRYLTNQGRLYFDSADSLVPADTNDGAEDVYQYEPGGVGSCERAGGCTTLVSGGREASDSNLLTIDEDGSSVFFTTRDRLVRSDGDRLIDLYVAREEGGIPAETEVGRGECQGEACQAPVSAPNDSTPASASVEGAGNVDERRHTKKHKKRHKAKKHAHKRAAKHNRGGVK